LKIKFFIYFLILLIGLMLFAGCTVSQDAELQASLDKVIKDDSRNSGIAATAYYSEYPSVIVFDIQSIEGETSKLDVFRVFLQFADALQEKKFDRVELAYQGKTKFLIKGEYFQQLGREYSTQNPLYTVRTFPSNVFTPDGKQAYGEWTGGILGVLANEMDDFNDLHEKWYWDEILYNNIQKK
jgi:hypothetical protein